MVFSSTRNLDGSHVEAPIVRIESVDSNWTPPADIAELFSRVHPNGAPETWARFFAGEEIEEHERNKIRALLSDHKHTPGKSGQQDETLTRIKNRIDSDLKAYAWLDTDHQRVVGPSCEQLAPAVSARAALDLQLRSINILLKGHAGSERVRVRYANDMHLLWRLFDAIVAAPADLPDEYIHLLPASTVERISARRKAVAREAKQARQAEEAQRLTQVEEEERRKIERMAAVEAATLDVLLFEVFSYDVGSSLRQGIESRALTAAQFDELAGLRETADPVRRRAVERLIEIGAEIMREIALKSPPTLEEIEAARQVRLREEKEAKQREIEARIEAMDAWAYPQICAEVNRLNLAPLDWVALLPRVTDITRVMQFRQFFIEQAPRQEEPLRRRVCELMIRHLGKRF